MLHLIHHPEARSVEFRDNRKGFWITFRNGWRLSVQWDSGHYCGMDTAEVAVVMPNEKLLRDPSGMSEVWGYLMDYEVLKAMSIVSKWGIDLPNDEAFTAFTAEMFGKREKV